MNPKPTSSMQRATAAGVEVDARAERLEQVRRSRQARSPSGCRAWRRGSPAPAATNAAVVETLKVGVAAAGAGGVEQVVRSGRRPARASSRIVRASPVELLDRLALRAQRDQEGRGLDLADRAAHDLAQDLLRLLGGQVAARRRPRRSPR